LEESSAGERGKKGLDKGGQGPISGCWAIEEEDLYLDYGEASSRMISEYWTEKTLEEFVSVKWGKPRISSVRKVGVTAIRTQSLLSSRRKSYSSSESARP
jgi:hypothetical protein